MAGTRDRRAALAAGAAARLGLGTTLHGEEQRAGADEQHGRADARSRADGGGEDCHEDRADDEDQLVDDRLEGVGRVQPGVPLTR